jgi:predicted nucleotidyltransferase
MSNQEIAKQNILLVARKLGHLRERVVFLGGSITALLITDPAAPDIRPTKDVDVAIRTETYAEIVSLDEELRALDFDHCKEPGAPACRWVIDECLVDIIPVGVGGNAYNDRWSPVAMKNAQHLELEEGLSIRHVTAPYFVAIKLETFSDRGGGNYLESNDINDIVQLIDGRQELMAELQESELDLRTYMAAEFRKLLENRDFLEAISAHLLPDAASQGREDLILKKMQEIAPISSDEL